MLHVESSSSILEPAPPIVKSFFRCSILQVLQEIFSQVSLAGSLCGLFALLALLALLLLRLC